MFLLRYSHLENDSEALHMAEVTLNAMLRGGIHDQIGAVFAGIQLIENGWFRF